MTYRNGPHYLAFGVKMTGKRVNSVSKAINYAEAVENSHLQDQPAVTESQNVFKSLEE